MLLCVCVFWYQITKNMYSREILYSVPVIALNDHKFLSQIMYMLSRIVVGSSGMSGGTTQHTRISVHNTGGCAAAVWLGVNFWCWVRVRRVNEEPVRGVPVRCVGRILMNAPAGAVSIVLCIWRRQSRLCSNACARQSQYVLCRVSPAHVRITLTGHFKLVVIGCCAWSSISKHLSGDFEQEQSRASPCDRSGWRSGVCLY